MSWLTFFIPSWRFFDRFGYVAKLEIHICGTQEILNIQPSKLKMSRLFLNAKGNYYLYQISSIQKFIEHISSYEQLNQSQIDKLKSFHSLNLIIQEVIYSQLKATPQYHFQIQINSGNGYELFYQSEVQLWSI